MISFTKTKLPFGWLGNMSSHKIVFESKEYRSAEALFQSLRFRDEMIIELIRSSKSPIGAKLIAKANADKMVIEPTSKEDLQNMAKVLKLKLEQHPNLLTELLNTKDEEIIEDVTNRPHGRNSFWGAALVDGKWIGENALGKLWMQLRAYQRNCRF